MAPLSCGLLFNSVYLIIPSNYWRLKSEGHVYSSLYPSDPAQSPVNGCV